jgi:Tat protein translocase TatB subunit
MYLLILESIGTSELLLVGIVALIVFGPRRLPEMMRKFGKLMAEFRSTTSQFKESWEKEVALDLEIEEKKALPNEMVGTENTIGKNSISEASEVELVPEIREIDKNDFDLNLPTEKVQTIDQNGLESSNKVEQKIPVEVNEVQKEIADKRNWL